MFDETARPRSTVAPAPTCESRPVVRRVAGCLIAAGIGAATLVGVAGTADAQLSSADQGQLLALHNQYRTEVGTPHVQWDAGLASTAQGVAANLLATGSNAHSTNAVGENIGSQGNSDANALKPENIVAGWYAERQNFLNHTGNSGHYTQMVSKAVQKIGCGEAKGPSGGLTKMVVVCQYEPQGNNGQPPF
jgi:uncharacterized protein YkwD